MHPYLHLVRTSLRGMQWNVPVVGGCSLCPRIHRRKTRRTSQSILTSCLARLHALARRGPKQSDNSLLTSTLAEPAVPHPLNAHLPMLPSSKIQIQELNIELKRHPPKTTERFQARLIAAKASHILGKLSEWTHGA